MGATWGKQSTNEAPSKDDPNQEPQSYVPVQPNNHTASLRTTPPTMLLWLPKLIFARHFSKHVSVTTSVFYFLLLTFLMLRVSVENATFIGSITTNNSQPSFHTLFGHLGNYLPPLLQPFSKTGKTTDYDKSFLLMEQHHHFLLNPAKKYAAFMKPTPREPFALPVLSGRVHCILWTNPALGLSIPRKAFRTSSNTRSLLMPRWHFRQAGCFRPSQTQPVSFLSCGAWSALVLCHQCSICAYHQECQLQSPSLQPVSNTTLAPLVGK